MFGCQVSEEFELQFVGILILVDHNVAVAVADLFAEFGVFIEDTIGEHQQVIEIDEIVFKYILLIRFIDFGSFLIVTELCFAPCDLRSQEGVFVFGDFAGKKGDIEIDIELFGDRSQESFFVVTVDNDKVILAAEFFDMKLEKKQAEFVKCAEERRIGGLVFDEFQCPLPHLCRCFVGEGQSECIARVDTDFADQIRQPAGQSLCLSASRPGKDEQWPIDMFSCCTLVGVEIVQDRFHYRILFYYFNSMYLLSSYSKYIDYSRNMIRISLKK